MFPTSIRAVPLLGVAFLHAPLVAQGGSPSPPDATGFPDPVPLAILIVAVCGALGAFAADLVTDGGRIERWRREEAGWSLGSAGKLVVGLVAAAVVLALNPPGASWAALVGSSLVAGLGGESMLLSVISARRAQDAEGKASAAREKAVEAYAKSVTDLRALEAVALSAHGAVVASDATDATDAAAEWSAPDVVAPHAPLAAIRACADHAVAEVRRLAARHSAEA